jgi:hypothetical protein
MFSTTCSSKALRLAISLARQRTGIHFGYLIDRDPSTFDESVIWCVLPCAETTKFLGKQKLARL